ncbi:MAG TPA: TetR/AcrR family transcriptional regulator [Rhodanobacteraceae bacterium]|nr:TetR/AcrR family transcriptional regulator [Rhodanobacteraceae bacterium]
MSAPSSPSAHQRILDAACQLFLENGYRVSMDAVARHAGVSKQTVYAHFSSKDALFRAAVEVLVTPLHASLDAHQDNIESSLRSLAETYSRHTSDPSNAALGRMLVAEAPRFPRAARQLFQSGSGAVLERLSERIGQSMCHGELRRDDPRQAAELFLSMLNGMNPQRNLLGLRSRGRKAQDMWASHAVNVFLRAYRPHSPAHSSRKSSS